VFHVKHEGWEDASRLIGLSLAPTQQDLLDTYSLLLRERAVPQGFISGSDELRLEVRHVQDSLRAAALVDPADRSACDVGSGAGLPGIPVAIACPWLLVHLVEARRARAAFLELAVEKLGLSNVRVINMRAEEATERVDICFARAFGSPEASWAVAEKLLLRAGRLVYFAGERFKTSQLPSDVSAEVVSSALARSGPLVIMTRT
jgi:16S rRNA (guanine(527)-N(7))-methyltransferase RsmG